MKNITIAIFMTAFIGCGSLVTDREVVVKKKRTPRKQLIRECIREFSVDNTLIDSSLTCMKIYKRI